MFGAWFTDPRGMAGPHSPVYYIGMNFFAEKP